MKKINFGRVHSKNLISVKLLFTIYLSSSYFYCVLLNIVVRKKKYFTDYLINNLKR